MLKPLVAMSNQDYFAETDPLKRVRTLERHLFIRKGVADAQ